MNKTFIFDLDDTLMWNLHDYSQPQLDLVKYVIDNVGPRAPNPPTILNLEEQIDKELVSELGFDMRRFPRSFVKAYVEICKTLSVPYTDKQLQDVYELGTQAFSTERWRAQGMVPGAKETLLFLREQGDELLLLTKGDYAIQERKIAAVGARDYFDEVSIVASKSARVILDFCGDRDKKSFYHVGNSLKSDVAPALEAGIGAIYIPLETWAWEKDHNHDLSKLEGVIKLDKISDLIGYYPKL